jgi:3-oxoacyl-[acyl-carrier protein] reductase
MNLKTLSEDDLNALKEETPLGTLGSPDDVAEAVYFFASEKSKFITGQILGVNGGFII